MKNYFLIIFVISLITVFSCKKPGSGSGTTPSTDNLTVHNTQWGYGTGSSTNWDMSNDADYKIKVRVNTLDDQSNAVVYYTHSFPITNTGVSDPVENLKIDVPSSGMFVIQVELIYSECTWQEYDCNEGGNQSKKSYFKQRTIQSPQAPYDFSFTEDDIEDQDCDC